LISENLCRHSLTSQLRVALILACKQCTITLCLNDRDFFSLDSKEVQCSAFVVNESTVVQYEVVV